MQKFNVDNVETRYIKSLLLNTYLPNFPIACVGDFIVADCHYVFGNYVIRCDVSGILVGNYDTATYENVKYVRGYNNDGTPFKYHSPSTSDYVVCRPDFICGVGVRTALYTVVASFGSEKQIPGITSNYVSHSNVYDGDTHKHFGRYLRWYKSATKIDVMSLYNCFVNHDTTQFHLTSQGLEDGGNSSYATWIVPALLNKSYQIFINSPSVVMVKGVFINDFGRVKYTHDGETIYLDTLLEDKVYTYNDVSYSNPLTYMAFTNNKTLIEHSNDFHIIIQVPNTHSGSVAVIEGETVGYNQTLILSRETYMDRVERGFPNIDYSSFHPLIRSSLTIISGKNQLPYSDRLIEYLLGSAITNREDTPNNILRLQEKLGITDKYNMAKDVWNDIIKYLLYNTHYTYTDNRYLKSSNSLEELSNLPDSKIVYKKDASGNIVEPKQVVGLKNMKNHMPSNIKFDILGFYDKDVENSLFKYKDV